MQIWINVADTLLFMSMFRMPSPCIVQKYRVENLYEGSMGEEAATAEIVAGGLNMIDLNGRK